MRSDVADSDFVTDKDSDNDESSTVSISGKLWRIRDVATYLGIPEKHAHMLMQSGDIPARTINRSWRTTKQAVDAFVEKFIVPNHQRLSPETRITHHQLSISEQTDVFHHLDIANNRKRKSNGHHAYLARLR